MAHGKFISELGGGTDIAAWLSKETKRKIDREAVYKWAENSVPWRWRPFLLKMAKERGIAPPKDFMPGVAA